MTRTRSIGLVLCGMLAGSALAVALLGRAGAQSVLPNRATLAAPIAPPPAAVAGARFRYFCKDFAETRYWHSHVIDEINGYGAQGWRWMGPGPDAQKAVHCFERTY